MITAWWSILLRIGAIMRKEVLQMRRDRMTFAMLLGIPVMQLILFGYAINLQPKHLPTAVHFEERSDITRSMVAAMEQSGYFAVVAEELDATKTTALLQSGEVNFVLSIPTGFSRALVRGERPQLLLEADASDPSASSTASAHFPYIIEQALAAYNRDPRGITVNVAPVDVVVHSAFNPRGVTSHHIVPGLLGVILTMTGVMITAITMTREHERGTMENLLAMPARPLEVMLGKILPYLGVGALQTLLILGVGLGLFGVPFVGQVWILLSGLLLFLLANLTLGFAFSTIATSQLQALQMTFFFFLPSILLSGFMFPFRGMPVWAQYIGEALPLTHFLRIVRGVMLKNADFSMLSMAFLAIAIFWLVAGLIAMWRYKVTLG
ncbi:ABC transporter permease [Suttonella sp. R2A3]|uniref:ABC transporter permease n=1 Tax=Suttonella sp. R2A3 TaxID=2908648 RepID=UPI001F25B270|nr:ABC transporter permease [Suttonella sp. R2A3]UJF24438.1 ABC transporter permease [Suttonella sp. R2A3]